MRVASGPDPPGSSRCVFERRRTSVSRVCLSATLATPASSGSTDTPWLCRGRLPPIPAPPETGCPQLHRPAATGRRRRSLTSTQSTSASRRTGGRTRVRALRQKRVGGYDCPIPRWSVGRSRTAVTADPARARSGAGPGEGRGSGLHVACDTTSARPLQRPLLLLLHAVRWVASFPGCGPSPWTGTGFPSLAEERPRTRDVLGLPASGGPGAWPPFRVSLCCAVPPVSAIGASATY